MKNSTKPTLLKNSLIQNFKLTSNTSFYKGIIVVLLISLMTFLTSCKKDYGEIVTNELKFSEFHSISISGSADVTVEYGTTQKVEVTGNVDILKKLKNEVKNFNLDLDLKNGIYHNYELSYRITIPKIESASIKGSGNMNIGDFEQTENIIFDISGSGDITFYAFPNINQLDIDIDGSGSVKAKSTIESLSDLNIKIDGSGEYSGYMVKSGNCDVIIKGSGDVKTYAINNLDIDIAGSGNVNYKGFPSINSNITGSGNVFNKN